MNTLDPFLILKTGIRSSSSILSVALVWILYLYLKMKDPLRMLRRVYLWHAKRRGIFTYVDRVPYFRSPMEIALQIIRNIQ